MKIPYIFEHLKNPKVIDCINIRHLIKQTIRSSLNNQGFLEIDTPILGPEFPEYNTNQFRVVGPDNEIYALPQSPQIYKQILVSSGLKKYYQFAHCFRQEPKEITENLHKTEFMQVDIEMQTNSINELMRLVEKLIYKVCTALNIDCKIPFPIVEGAECKKNYGTNKPDLRKNNSEYSFIWVVNLPLLEEINFERIKVTSSTVLDNSTKFILSHHIFAKPYTVPKSSNYKDLADVKTYSFDLILNGIEICSGDLRIIDRYVQEHMMNVLGFDKRKYQFYLNALDFASDNGGLALGLDRLTMIFSGSTEINYANAFNDFWWNEV